MNSRLARGLAPAVLVAVLAYGSLAVAQMAVDPQSLAGEWVGTWQDKAPPGASGAYYLTIEKVDGNKVTGKGEVLGRPSYKFPFVGVLSGNRLTFGRDTVVDLTIDGDRMEGGSTGQVNRVIKLVKKK